MKPRLHIVYTESLDSQAAAAVVKWYGARHGTTVHCYPLFGTLSEREKKATLRERIFDRVYGSQRALPLLDDHDRSREVIYLLDGGLAPCDQVHAMEDWGLIEEISAFTREVSQCHTAWVSLMDGEPVPLAIQLIHSYVINGNRKAKNLTYWIDEVLPFKYALDSVNIDPGTTSGWDEEWEKLFDTLVNAHVRKRITEGKAIVRYIVRQRIRVLEGTVGDEPQAPAEPDPTLLLVDVMEQAADEIADGMPADTTVSFQNSRGEHVEIQGRQEVSA
jgi:hypothetical protein